MANERAGDGAGPKIVGFVCEWAAQLDEYTNEDGTLHALPDVHIIKIPCSGYVKPAWLQQAIQDGADGAFVCGCAMVDCHYREGNLFIRDRILGNRNPYLPVQGRKGGGKGVRPEQVRDMYHAGTGGPALIREIHQFAQDLAGGEVPIGPLVRVREHEGPVLDTAPLNPTGPDAEPQPIG